MNQMQVEIVSAEHAIYSGKATMIIATAEGGEIGIQAGHAQLLATLKPGQVRLLHDVDRTEEVFYISGGFIEVQPYVVTILADTALRAKDVDEAAAIDAKERAEKALAERGTAQDFAKVAAELAQAVAQLQAIRMLRERGKR
jgi:F-type H+-transporting ATPase subunit epsilon